MGRKRETRKHGGAVWSMRILKRNQALRNKLLFAVKILFFCSLAHHIVAICKDEQEAAKSLQICDMDSGTLSHRLHCRTTLVLASL